MRMGMRWRVAAGGAVAAAALVASSSPAGAVFTTNTVGCSGSAVITSPDGETYEGDARDVSVEVPREGVAAWEGSINPVTHNHFGEVNLAVGPLDVQLGKWGPSENADDEASSSGTKEIPTIMQYALPGEYVVSGFHQGDEGGCSGFVVVAVDVSPFSTPTGVGALVFTVLSGALMVGAGIAKAPKL